MYKENGIIKDSFQAFLVEDANFTDNEEYPIIEDEMVSLVPPKQIVSFSEAINYKGDLSNSYICFYSQDSTFERIRRNPRRYVDFFKRTAGIIGFDFSIHTDMPIIKQKAQMNDNLSLTYFYGKHGIKVIPNIRCGVDDLLPEFLDAIPKHSLIAVGTYGFIKERQQKAEWFCCLETIIKSLEPTGIIVYGTLNGKMFDKFKEHTKFYFYDSWSDKRRKELINNAN